MRKVSFDFDGTLSRLDVQEYAKSLILKGIEIQVTTARNESPFYLYQSKSDWNKDLFKVTDSLEIHRSNIVFCSNMNKALFLDESILFHLDDDFIELEGLLEMGRCIGVDVTKPNWIKECNYKLY